VDVSQGRYRLVRVFKHDFWAATCLYELEDRLNPGPSGTAPSPIPRIVVKFARRQGFCGLPLKGCAEWLTAREEAIYKLLRGIDGVPSLLGRTASNALAIEYIDASPLDHLTEIPAGLFDRIAKILHDIHARGVAYCDANKRSNILVTDDGKPFLVDYQIAISRKDHWYSPLREIMAALVEYLAGRDMYHLYKHKRRLAADELRPEEEVLSRRRGRLHRVHRALTKPYRAIRRRFLQHQYAKGALKSPTAELEDHHQPEKQTWRKGDRARTASERGDGNEETEHEGDDT
jgi:hypothetical protein